MVSYEWSFEPRGERPSRRRIEAWLVDRPWWQLGADRASYYAPATGVYFGIDWLPDTAPAPLRFSVDLVLPADSDILVIVARVYNDAGTGGTAGFTEEAIDPSGAFDSRVLFAGATGVLIAPPDLRPQPATRHEIVVRMLVNLKRLYVRMRSFPQARFVADLLLAVDPSAVSELRDRGLRVVQRPAFRLSLR